jgi:hypothetical protein
MPSLLNLGTVGVICQLHAQAVVIPGEEPSELIEKKAVWVSEAIETIWNRTKGLAAVNTTILLPSNAYIKFCIH